MMAARLRAEDLASRVVVLANAADEDSLLVARRYCELRGVPRDNVIALPMSRAETITWPEFVRTIEEPLLAELVKRQWIDGIPMKLTDPVGRTKYAVSGHRIAYFVTCRGVPVRILHDPGLYTPAPPATNNGIFRTNCGAVDAELSLLARPNYPINAYVANPLFGDDHPTSLEQEQVVKVSRLDGPTPADAIGLVERALAAERTGLLGRAYIDIGGNHADGERWLGAAAKQLEELGFDTDVDRSRATIPATARFDAPVLYFGWYASKVNGPFALPGFRFPPGAVALHIHSYSAARLRTADEHWCGPLIARGVTATVGNVFEPYLQLTHRPDYLLRALASGKTWGDAVYYALPVLSWEPVAIGDPLYRPFAVPFETQWAERAKLPPRLAGYAALREMNRLDAADRSSEALAVARAAQREAPSLAVGVEWARRLAAAGDRKGAVAALGFARLIQSYPTGEWALAEQAAALLRSWDEPAGATDVYRALLGTEELPRELRLKWLPEAKSAAVAAGDRRQADAWAEEIAAAEILGGEKVEKK